MSLFSLFNFRPKRVLELDDARTEHVMIQRPLQRVLAFTRRSIDDVVNELPHRHSRIISASRERLPCSPLIPIDDGEVALQRLCVPPHECQPGGSGAAVNEEDNRTCRVLRTNQHPLASFVDWNLLEDSNTIRVPASIDLRGCTWNDEERNRDRYQDSKDKESHHSFISPEDRADSPPVLRVAALSL